jgi:hypothetical protein
MDHLRAIVAPATLLHARGQYKIENELKFKKIEPLSHEKELHLVLNHTHQTE